jgi:hypothetical protein
MLTEVWITGSGKAAMAERATATLAKETAAPAKNCRRELGVFEFLVMFGCP